MDDLKVPIIVLLCIIGGLGYYFYDRANNPKKIKPLKPKTVTSRSVTKVKEEKRDFTEAVQKAKKYFNKGDYEKTFELLSDAENEKNYDIQRMLAYCYSHFKDYDKAIVVFEKALKERMVPADGYSLAYLYELTGRFEAAAVLYFELVELTLPPNLKLSVYEGIARLSAYMPLSDNICKYTEELVKEWPESRDGVLNLIKIKRQKESYTNIDVLEKSVNKYFSTDYNCNYELARLYDEAEKYIEAVNCYKKCIKIDSKVYTPFLDCYKALIKANKIDAAIKALEYFMESGQIFPTTFFDAALVANRAKRFKQAFRFYLTAVSSDAKFQGYSDEGLVSNVKKAFMEKGTETEKVFVNAFICYINGDYNYAISEIKRIEPELENSVYKEDYKLVLKGCEKLAAIDQRINNQQMAYDRYIQKKEEAEKLKNKMKELKKAKKEAKAAKDGNSGSKEMTDEELKNKGFKESASFDSQMMVAKEFNRRGKYVEAKSFFNSAIAVDPKAYEPYFEIAKIDLNDDNIESAQSNIEKAVEYNPENISVLNLAALISLNGNDLTNALAYAEASYSRDSNDTNTKIVFAKIYMKQQNIEQAKDVIEEALSVEKNNAKRAELLKLKKELSN